jgi:hypothetical protein
MLLVEESQPADGGTGKSGRWSDAGMGSGHCSDRSEWQSRDRSVSVFPTTLQVKLAAPITVKQLLHTASN